MGRIESPSYPTTEHWTKMTVSKIACSPSIKNALIGVVWFVKLQRNALILKGQKTPPSTILISVSNLPTYYVEVSYTEQQIVQALRGD